MGFGGGQRTLTAVHFCLVRLDDRLLHGQVVLNWVRALRPARIAVVDERLAQDAWARATLFSVAPAGISLWVGGAEEAPQALLLDLGWPPSRTMVLVPNPDEALRLYLAGVPYAALNLGCLGMAPGRIRLLPQLSLSPREMEVLRSLALKGVQITAQALPGQPVVPWEKLYSKVGRSSSSG